jgi:hypothetical protein
MAEAISLSDTRGQTWLCEQEGAFPQPMKPRMLAAPNGTRERVPLSMTGKDMLFVLKTLKKTRLDPNGGLSPVFELYRAL